MDNTAGIRTLLDRFDINPVVRALVSKIEEQTGRSIEDVPEDVRREIKNLLGYVDGEQLVQCIVAQICSEGIMEWVEQERERKTKEAAEHEAMLEEQRRIANLDHDHNGKAGGSETGGDSTASKGKRNRAAKGGRKPKATSGRGGSKNAPAPRKRASEAKPAPTSVPPPAPAPTSAPTPTE